jgi:hypothetical protein
VRTHVIRNRDELIIGPSGLRALALFFLPSLKQNNIWGEQNLGDFLGFKKPK